MILFSHLTMFSRQYFFLKRTRWWEKPEKYLETTTAAAEMSGNDYIDMEAYLIRKL